MTVKNALDHAAAFSPGTSCGHTQSENTIQRRLRVDLRILFAAV